MALSGFDKGCNNDISDGHMIILDSRIEAESQDLGHQACHFHLSKLIGQGMAEGQPNQLHNYVD